jgi:hypothetical protein
MLMQWVVGSLTILTGLTAIGVGMAVAIRSLDSARRVYRRTASRSAATLEAWGAWFVGGFSGLTMGIRWLYAVALWLGWTAAGIGLIGLGIRLLS